MSKVLTDISPKLIRHYRKLAGYTLEQAAKKAGIEAGTISRWENGETSPHPPTFGKFAKALNKDVADFFPVKVMDLREKATAVIDDYLSDGDEDKSRQSRIAIDLMKIPRSEMIELEPMDDIDLPTQALDHWKKESIKPFFTDSCVQFWEFKGDEIILRGPARCGKTTLRNEYIISKMMQNPNMEVLITRAFSVDLDAERQNLRELLKYHFSDPLSPIKAHGGTKFDRLEINGGNLYLKGIDRSSGQLGAGFDIVVHGQAEQIKKENIDIINSRVTPAGERWIDDGVPRSMVIYDLNPNRLDNWVERLITPDDPDVTPVRCINYTFTDHPAYFTEDGQETELYRQVLSRLERLDGVVRTRLLEGRAANPEGTVFSIEPCHILDKLPDDFPQSYYFHTGMDFGMKDPNVCLWFAIHRATGDIIVYKEWRRTNVDVKVMGDICKKFTEQRVIQNVIDNNESNQRILTRDCGITNTIMAEKGPHSIASGINLLEHRLELTRQGKDGGIYFYNNPVGGRDPNLIRDNAPLTTLDEFELYSWEKEKDKPIDKYNNGIDVIRYELEVLENAQPALGFGSGGVKRQKRI